MLKWTTLWVLLFLGLPCSGQYYVSDIGDPNIDHAQQQFDSLFTSTNYLEAGVQISKILEYWSTQKSKFHDLNTLNNYYYSLIGKFNVQLKQNTSGVYDSLVSQVIAIENSVAKNFEPNYPLVAKYFDLIGDVYYLSRLDDEKALNYFQKSKKIKETLPLEYNLSKAKTYEKIGDYWIRNSKFDKAKDYFDKVLHLRRTNNPIDSVGIAFATYSLSRIYERTNEPEKWHDHLIKAASIAQRHLGKRHEFYLKTQGGLANYYIRKTEFNEALSLLNKKLEAERKRYGESDKSYNTYINMALVFYRLNRFEEAKDIYLQILENKTKANIKTGTSILYNNLGLLSSELADEHKYYEKAIATCMIDPKCTEYINSIFVSNISRVYTRKGDYLKAINYLNKSRIFQEADPNQYGKNLSKTYNSLATNHHQLGNIKTAKVYAQKVVEAVQKFIPDDKGELAHAFANLAYFAIEDKEYDKAEKLINKALKLEEHSDKLTNVQSANTLDQLGYLYKAKGDFPKSITAFKKSHLLFLRSRGNVHPSTNNALYNLAEVHSKMGQLDSTRILIGDILKACGFAKFEKGKVNNYKIGSQNLWDSFDQLTRCFPLESKLSKDMQPFLREKILTGFRLIDQLKSSYYFESSEIKFQKSTRVFNNWALRQLIAMYKKDNLQETLDLIFTCIERSKSIVTQRTIERDKAVFSGLVPKQVVRREKRIITDYEKAYGIFLENEIDPIDSLTNSIEEEMFSLEKEKALFLDSLALNFPEYYKKRYTQKSITLQEAKKMSKSSDKGIISYHWGDSLLYRFIISPERTIFDYKPIEDVKASIDIFQDLLYKKNAALESDFLNDKMAFIESGHKLYKLLLDSEQKLPEELVIIPSGPLTQIPFDCLLIDHTEVSTSYKAMPYLMRKHIISYLGSTILMSDIKGENRPQNKKEYLGFAPNSISNQSQLALSRDIGLSNLLYNEEEINQTSSLFDGDYFLGENATEQAFNNNAAEYRLLHLAMHAKSNELTTQNSYLSFAPDSLELEDGKLSISEIAKMDLNNDLVVLSACETNVGKQNLGEGILGIARAFQFASCRNIIMSNWLLDDRSSSRLVFSFFKSFKTNSNPAKALRDAKLEFLENCSTVNSHPRYWAAFSYYGNSSAVSTPKSFTTKFWIGIGVILFLLLFIGGVAYNKSNT